ncbi:MAG: hypothetical protein ACFB4I_10870 [Cyanophyceae cyanobacterium]
MISLGHTVQPSRQFNGQGLSSCLLVFAWLCVSFTSWRWLAQELIASRFHFAFASLIAVGLLYLRIKSLSGRESNGCGATDSQTFAEGRSADHIIH